jgi:hypothetical protein
MKAFARTDLTKSPGPVIPVWLTALLCVVLWQVPTAAVSAEPADSVQHFKMLSTLQYVGKEKFENQVETLLTVEKRALSEDRVEYSICADNFDLLTGSSNLSQQDSLKGLSFVLDKQTRRISQSDAEWALFATVNNESIGALKHTTRENIGKTWQQSFQPALLGAAVPKELKFTLTAIPLQTKLLGELVAVRAVSEPFVFNTTKLGGGSGQVQSGIGTVYVFDPQIQEVYLTISVFEATTNVNGFKETLRHELAAYRADENGVAADFTGLGKQFERLVRKLGLSAKSLKPAQQATLPRWVRSEGLFAAQVTGMYAALACEGASNPVAAVCVPAARVVALQGQGRLAAFAKAGTVGAALAKSVPAVASMKIAVAPAFMGVGLVPAGAAAAGGTVAIASGTSGDSRSHVRSPSQP